MLKLLKRQRKCFRHRHLTGVEKDVIPYGLVTGNRSHLEGINIIGLKRAGYSSDEINGLNQAVKLIFSNVLLKNGIEEAKKFSNLKTVSEVISFLGKSEKRPIIVPSAKISLDRK